MLVCVHGMRGLGFTCPKRHSRPIAFPISNSNTWTWIQAHASRKKNLGFFEICMIKKYHADFDF